MSGPWLLSYVALWLLVLLLVIGTIGVLRQIGLLYEHASQPDRPRTKLRSGERVPEIRLEMPTGQRVRLAELIESPTPVLIVSPTCGGCSSLLGQIARGERGSEVARRVIVVSMSGAREAGELATKAGLSPETTVLIDTGGEIRRVWGVHATPTVVLIDEDLRVMEQHIGFLNGAVLDGALY
jgi:peroxiredoxin